MFKQYRMKRAALVLVALLSTGLAACDFSAIQNPLDDFALVIGLEPINTVVTAQVIDAATGAPVRGRVTLTFAGEAAGRVIDVYSDPIAAQQVEGGVTTFGIENDLVPIGDSPVHFTVTAQAEGYLPQSAPVVLTEVGDGNVVVRLLSDDPQQNPQGSTGTRNTAVTTSASGASSTSVTVTTAPAVTGLPTGTATATMTIPQGTVAKTASGQPLVGTITTDLRAFGTNYASLTALPEGARRGPGGTAHALAGALYLKVSDAQGNVAATFEGTPGAGKASTGLTCASGVPVSIDLPGSTATLVSAGDELQVFAYSVAAKTTSEVGRALVEEEGGVEKASFCMGAKAGEAPYYVDVATPGVDVSAGVFYTVVTPSNVCTASTGALVKVRNGNPLSVTGVELRLIGPGVATTIAASASFAAGGEATYRLSDYVDASVQKPLAGDVGYRVVALLNGDEQEDVTLEVDPCVAATTSLDLPAQTSAIQASVTAVLDCGAGRRLDPQVAPDAPFDGLSLGYRQETASTYTIIPKRQVGYAVTKQKVTITTATPVNVVAGRSYVFSAVMGTGSYRSASIPAAADMSITVLPSDVGLSCVAE